MIVKIIILFSLVLSLTACTIAPHRFRNDHDEKTGRHTTYNVTDFDDGFRVDMTYYKFELGGMSDGTIFTARHKLKNLVNWIAEARKRKIEHLKTKDFESSHYYNSVTNYSYWKGTVRAHYKDK